MANLLHPPEIRRRNQYNRWLLYDALKCVLRGKMNCHQAAIRFKVPRSTIQRKLNLCREQHRLALKLKLQNELPSCSDERRNQSMQEERCDIDARPNDHTTGKTRSTAQGLVAQNMAVCDPVAISSTDHVTQENIGSNTFPNENTDMSISLGRLPATQSAYSELLTEPRNDVHVAAIELDQYTEDEIEFCGEEHVIGDGASSPTDGVSIRIDDGTIHIVEVPASDTSQNVYNDTIMLYTDDTTTTVAQHFLDTNCVRYESDDYAYLVDPLYGIPMGMGQRTSYGEYVGIDELDSLHLRPQQFAARLQLRCMLEDANTEENEIEKAADRLSESFRSVPSKSKLPKYLSTSTSQHGYAYRDYELKQPSRNDIVLPSEFVLLRRHQPTDYSCVEEPREVREMVVMEDVDLIYQHI